MQINLTENQCYARAFVVFEKETNIKFLRILKKGFRHCFIVIRQKDGWLEINPLSNRLLVVFHADKTIKKVPYFLIDKNKFLFVEAEVQAAPPCCAPLFFFTCVEFVKHFLGIHDFFIMTPYQLYKKIKNCRKKILTNGIFHNIP